MVQESNEVSNAASHQSAHPYDTANRRRFHSEGGDGAATLGPDVSRECAGGFPIEIEHVE